MGSLVVIYGGGCPEGSKALQAESRDVTLHLFPGLSSLCNRTEGWKKRLCTLCHPS